MSQLFNEREKFVAQFSKEIDATKTRLKVNCKAYIDNTLKKFVSESDVKILENLLQMDSLENFSNYLRSLSVGFTDSFERSRFWQIIDGVNFFSDSVGLNWPYLSYGMRSQYLTFADQEIKNFRCNAW